MDDFRIENGKNVVRWSERHRVSLLHQLGLLPG